MCVRLLYSFIVFFILSSNQVFSQKAAKSLNLFTINKKAVSSDEFIYLYKKNHRDKEGEFNQDKIEEYLDLYIKFKLKVEEARQRGMDTTSKFTKEYLGYKEALRKPYLPDNKLVDSLAQLTYSRMLEEVKASHILIRVAPDASPADTLKAYNKITDIKKRIEAGEDFGTVAINASEDPSAKSNEGSLGYFTALQMVYPFETAAYTTPVGDLSKPVRTRFGYHLIKVVDKRKAVGEVEVSHILIRSGKDRDDATTKRQAFEVYDRLQGGMNWDELCRQYSEDVSTKDTGGRLRPFGVGAMTSVPEFEKTAFSLLNPGDYSAPFSSQYGWHIVKLERKIPVPSYQELEASLKSRVSRDERMQTAKESIQKSLRSKYKFTEVAETKRQVMLVADSALQRAAWKKPENNLQQLTLFSLQGLPVKADKFFEYVLGNQKANKLLPSNYFNQLYENFVNASIEGVVEQSLMQTNADYRYLSNEYYEGILLFDIMEKEVWNRASDDSLGQRNYFNQNSAKYTAGERAQALIYSSSKSESITLLQNLLAADSVVKDSFLKKNAIRFEQGRFEQKDRNVLAKLAWKPGLSKVELDGISYLVQIDNILPPGDRTFEEAKGLLVADYQTYLENQWLTELQQKYPVKIHAKGKKYVLEKLTNAN